MSHFALLWKARTIEKYRQNYENEKINSIIMSNADIPDKTLRQRWRHYSHDVQKRLSRSFSKWYPEGTTVSNFFVSLKTDMRLPTILLRSLYGFVGGLLLTYLGFMFFVFQLSLSLMNATVLSSVLGVLLTLGLTFSNRMRCIIFLLIPQLFSRVGRYTLTCYALVLILTGPATNTLKNSEVLSESMACSQEQIKLSVRHINDSIRKPFNSMNDSLKITIGSMKLIVRKLKIALIRINRLILSIASVIQSGFSWLDSVANRCNEALGPPHEKCLNYLKYNFQTSFEHNLNQAKPKHAKRTFRGDLKNLLDVIGVKEFKRHKEKELVKDFKRFKEGELKPKNEKEINLYRGGLKAKNVIKSNVKKDQEWFNNAANIAKIACGSLKSYDKFCVPADFTQETFLATIRQKLKIFTHRLNRLLYVKLNIHHTYIYIGNSSSINMVQTGIVTEIRKRADPLLTWLSWSSCVTSLFLLLIIFRAKHYQLMFETRPRFDNRFITKEFRELDLRRLREGKATVLPLNKRERAKYVTTTSFRLVASEKFHLNRSAVFMTIATFKLLIHIVADYSLYWVLTTINYHGKRQTPLPPGIPDTGAFISGVGFVSRLLQSFLDTLNLQLSLPPPDSSCLPNPYPPDFKRYCQIGFLIFLLWFFAIFEPYGLRVRHLIMGHHRPERAKDRAEWLYNHILKNRASFMKFARRRLHREYKYYSSHAKLTCHYWLRTHIPFYWLRSILGIKPEEPFCLLCHTAKDTSDPDKELIKCEVTNCPGTYCTSCFSDIGQLCTICLSPSDYGDFSDVSLVNEDEDDSDSEDNNFNGLDNSDLSDDKRSNSDDGRNNTDGEYDDASPLLALEKPRASNYGKQKQDKCLLGNDNTSEKFLILQLANEVQVLVCKNECQLICQPFKPRFTKDPNCSKNIVNFKDLNNNNIDFYSIKAIESYQYSVYEITKNPFDIKKSENTTQFAKYLRKKKIIRCKRKDSKKNLKYFMTCSNTNINIISKGITNIAGNDDPAKDSNNFKNTNCKAKMCKFTSKNDDNKKINSPDKQSYPKNYNTKFKNKKAEMKSKPFYTKFAKHWKHFKFTILPCTCLTNTKTNIPTIKEKKHKRKKKRKKSKTRNVDVKSELNKDVEITENSRLFAYLDDRDWVQNRDKNAKQLDIVTARIAIDIEKHTRQVDESIIVNDVLIPRLNLNLSSNSTIFEPQINSIMCESSKNIPNLTSRIYYAKSALDRFFKSIVGKTNNLLVTSSDEVVKCKVNSMHENKSFGPRADSTSENSRDSCVKDVRGFRLQRVSSRNFSGYKLSRPMPILKGVYSSILTYNSSAKMVDKKSKKLQKEDKKNKEENNEKGIKRKDKKIRSKNKTLQTRAVIIKEIERTDEKKIETIHDYQDDKEIQTFNLTEDKAFTVFPMTYKSQGCQKDCGCTSTQECGVEVTRTPVPRARDEEVMAIKQTCTCATQYKLDEDECTCITEICRDNARTLGTGYCKDSLTESSSIESEGSRTDTTVCSLANVKYRKGQNRRNKDKGHTKVVTKSNKSTLTDKARYYDVSTATYDWWSPIVEKKNIPKIEDNRRYETRRKYCETRKERGKVYKNRGMSTTAEKMVQFRSRALLIPSNESGPSDMLTPLRYLLDSQKHYNELYAIKFNVPQVYPVTNSQKYQNQEKDRSQVSSRHQSHRVRKSKRLEGPYSPRKQASPRRRGIEFVRAQELSKMIRKNKPKNYEECNEKITTS